MRLVPWALAVLAAGCGGGGSDSRFDVVPTAPSTATVTGTLSDTVTGAPLGTFSRAVSFLPAVLEFTADGHYPPDHPHHAPGAGRGPVPAAGLRSRLLP